MYGALNSIKELNHCLCENKMGIGNPLGNFLSEDARHENKENSYIMQRYLMAHFSSSRSEILYGQN